MSNSCISHFLPACGRSRITDLAGSTISYGGEYTDDLDGAMSRLSSGGNYQRINIFERDTQSTKDDVLLSSSGEYGQVGLERLSLQSTKDDVLISSSGEYATIGLQQVNTQSTKDDVLMSSSGLYNRI